MSVLQIVFLITGFITLSAAIMVALSPKLVHAAVWLILALAGVAVLFITLEAGFLAVVQVAIYIDAIAILIVITVMLTHKVMRPGEAQINRSWILAGVAALILFSGLTLLILQIPGLEIGARAALPEQEVLLEDLGRALVDVDQFVVPFEVASILLVAALIGAIIIALRPMGREGP